MPRFRLVADHGEPAQEFDAADPDAAEARARRLSTRYPTAKGTGYRLEQEVDGRWRLVRAWVPRRVAHHPGGTGTLVPTDAEPTSPLAEEHRRRTRGDGPPAV